MQFNVSKKNVFLVLMVVLGFGSFLTAAKVSLYLPAEHYFPDRMDRILDVKFEFQPNEMSTMTVGKLKEKILSGDFKEKERAKNFILKTLKENGDFDIVQDEKILGDNEKLKKAPNANVYRGDLVPKKITLQKTEQSQEKATISMIVDAGTGKSTTCEIQIDSLKENNIPFDPKTQKIIGIITKK